MKKPLAIAFLVAGTAASWFAWLAWDDTYQLDSLGRQSGPYEAWQVIGSGVTVILVVIVASRYLEPWTVGFTAGISYAVAWGWTLVPTDETGLVFVGLFMVLIGVFVGTVVVAAISEATWKAVGRSRTSADVGE